MSNRGCLLIVGLGPGAAATLTPQAREAIGRSGVVIGYEGYFAWVADLVAGKECIALPLTQEVERAAWPWRAPGGRFRLRNFQR